MLTLFPYTTLFRSHKPAEAPPTAFDQKTGDFQLTRALDVLKYGSVQATPKLVPPTATLADAAALRAGHGASLKPGASAPTPVVKPN